METVRDILEVKGSNVYAVRLDAPVYEALSLMAEKNIGAVLVLNEQGELAGILSERDYARKSIATGDDSIRRTVSELMSKRVTCVPPTLSVDDCMALMTENRIRHLPVLDDGRLVGLVSIGDVVKAEIHEKEFVIEQLEHYITGSL